MKNFIRLLKSVLLCTLIVVCICGCGKKTAQYISSQTVSSSTESEIEIQESEQQENTKSSDVIQEAKEEQLLYIYVCGAVQNPGVYTLSEGSRVCDLFEAAGGLTEDAATEYWNQARLLVDGEMVYVPTIQEAEERALSGLEASSSRSDSADTDDTTGRINLNTASLEQLMEIPGIGEAKAKAIINYREKNGGFSSIEEVMNIEGIKEGVFSKMKEYIVVN